jgi:hypothetical protein
MSRRARALAETLAKTLPESALPMTSAPMVGTLGCCARCERPRARRAAEQRDERAAL